MRASIILITCFAFSLPLTLGQYPPLYPSANSLPRINEAAALQNFAPHARRLISHGL
jgi:hypothetical protein